MEEVRCPVCGNDITDHPDFCPRCGFHPLDFSDPLPAALKTQEAEPSKMHPYTSVCPHCGHTSDPDMIHCPFCGKQKIPMPDSYVSESRNGFDKHVMQHRVEPYGGDDFDKHPNANSTSPFGGDDFDKWPAAGKDHSGRGKAGILMAAALIILIAIIILVILR